jgi:hypothetical protein
VSNSIASYLLRDQFPAVVVIVPRHALVAYNLSRNELDALLKGLRKSHAMNLISFRPLAICSLMMLVIALAHAPLPAQAAAGWHDDLVAHMAGGWKLQGPVMGHAGHHDVEAEWVLNHQFLRIHEKTSADAPPDEHRYEATWFLGYDPVGERYVLHLLDVFGARFSETLGYETRAGNAINFVFEYPDGPFHTTFQWSPETNGWEWLMEQKNKEGKWAQFADLKLIQAAR